MNDLEKTLTKSWGAPDVVLKKTDTPRTNTASQLGVKPGVLMKGDPGSPGGFRHVTLWTGTGDINENYGHFVSDTDRLLLWNLPTE